MNITHIIIGLNVGGAELMLARLIETQRVCTGGGGHRVVSLTTVGEIGHRLRAQGVEVTALGMVSVLRVPITFWRLFWLLRFQRPDIVQTWMYHADLLGGLAARLAGIRAVVWGIRTTDITVGGSRVTRVVRWLCARFSRRVPRRIICAANASLRVHAALGYDAARMTVIPNGVVLERMVAAPDAVAALRAEHGLGPEARVVGMVGRFNAVKGQQDFIAAAGQIARGCPQARFLMVGLGCDADNGQLAAWIAQSGVAERFVLLGKRADVPVCLKAMDVFVMPSRTEGFPNVLAEAMAMARPCVVTDVGDARVVLGGCGSIVPPQSPAALADAVLAMLAADQGTRDAQGKAARQRVESEYTMARSAQSFESLYNDLVGRTER
jgi:glycosyltransferase involved in cell wall biosynthesis